MKHHFLTTLSLVALLSPFVSAPASAQVVDTSSTYSNASDPTEDVSAESLASSYVDKAFEAWDAKTKASLARLNAEKAATQAVEANNAYLQAREKATLAHADYETKRLISVNWAREMMRNPATSLDPSFQAITMSASDVGDLARNIRQVESVNDIKQKSTMDADAALLAANAAEQEAQALLGQAQNAEKTSAALLANAQQLEIDAATLLQDAKQSLTEASTQINSKEIAEKISAKTEGEDKETTALPASQRILNQSVADKWKSYKKTLKSYEEILPAQNEKVSVPFAEQLLRGDTTASRTFVRQSATETPIKPLPLYTETGAPQPGGSRLEDGTVLISSAAIKRVQKAINYLGTPYEELSCQALVSEVSGQKKTRDLNKLFSSAYQNQSLADTLPGDIVFFADAHGISQAGVNIGGGLVVASSAASKSVIVIEMNENALISTRPDVEYDKDSLQKAPTSSEEDSISWECGGIASSFGSVSGVSWVLPFGDRDYTMELSFGDEDKRFKDNTSPGLLMSSPKKAAVQAAFAGVARVKETEKRGKTVTLRYNENISVRYSGLSKVAVTDGTFVGVGDPIGVSGNTGTYLGENDKPSVFVEVLIKNEPIDAEYMFFPPEEAGSEGYPNGLIPEEILCPIDIGSHILRCDAAQNFKMLNAAYKAEFGADISVTDSYRTLESQKRLKKQKPVLAATPGKSNHGWGLALDLGGGINSFGTPQYNWMLENAPAYGWENPEWAQKNGSKPEPWHFEFFSAVKK